MRIFAIVVSLLGMLLPGKMEAARPNILIITTDDQGYADLSCMGSKDIPTPNLDALAARGALCKAFYSNSPVCSPSRAALMTGRFPARTRVRLVLAAARGTKGLSVDTPTMAEVLKANGYATFLSGKWHLGSSEECLPMNRGFDRMFGFHAGCVDFYSHIYYGSQANPIHDLWENGEEVWRNGEYATDMITEKAIESIVAAGDAPFFGYVAYNAPHYPLQAPAEAVAKFAHLPPDRRMIAAMLFVVDDGVGRIMKTLEERGLLENTFVFFMSDNGPSRETRNWLNGDMSEFTGGSAAPFRGAKSTLWEGGIRVPAIFSWPAEIPEHQTIDTPVVAMDVFPTVMAAAGVSDSVKGLDGVNLLPLLRDGTQPAARDLFWEHRDQTAIRRGDWKLIMPNRDEAMLVNLKTDPREETDLAPENRELGDELKRTALKWRDEVTGN